MRQGIFPRKPAPLPDYPEKCDIPLLINALASPDPEYRRHAQKALTMIGSEATNELLGILEKKKGRYLRLGIIGVLAAIKDPEAVPVLIGLLHDPSDEIRWQTVLALGEIGGSAVAAPLTGCLKDPDKFVRHGAVLALKKTGSAPAGDDETGWYAAGLPDWDALLHTRSTEPLIFLTRDTDREIRRKAVQTLGERKDPAAGSALLAALGDPDRGVRWEAFLAAEKCSVDPAEIPRGLFGRPRAVKNPLIAGFLNFLLPGLGYGYLGKWWGIMIFQIDITVTVWLFKIRGEADTYSLLFPLYILLALHAWYITRQMPEDPP